jgi:site-specific recombinase XerD
VPRPTTVVKRFAACGPLLIASRRLRFAGFRRRDNRVLPVSEITELPELVERYALWLERQPLSERTRREYARQVAGFAEWLGADPARDGDALAESFARDYAVRDFKRHLKLECRWSPAAVNLALAAVDHFFRFVGAGAAEVSRERLLQPRRGRLRANELLAFVRAAATGRSGCCSCMGLRLSVLVALDLDDARVSGRKAVVVIRSGKGDVYREVPLNAPAQKALDERLKKRPAPAARTGGEPPFVSRVRSMMWCASSAGRPVLSSRLMSCAIRG